MTIPLLPLLSLLPMTPGSENTGFRKFRPVCAESFVMPLPVHNAPPPFTQATTASYQLDLKTLLTMHRSRQGPWVFPGTVLLACALVVGVVIASQAGQPRVIFVLIALGTLPLLRMLGVRAAYGKALLLASGGADMIHITASMDREGLEIDGGWQRTYIRWNGISSYQKNEHCLVLYRQETVVATLPADRVPVSFIAGATRYLDGADVVDDHLRQPS